MATATGKSPTLITRDAVRIAEELRQSLVDRRGDYLKQMDILGRLVGVMEEKIKELNDQLAVLRRRS